MLAVKRLENKIRLAQRVYVHKHDSGRVHVQSLPKHDASQRS